jgi:hypothetical protein
MKARALGSHEQELIKRCPQMVCWLQDRTLQVHPATSSFYVGNKLDWQLHIFES